VEALILAAGYATRLGDLTANRAKPLLPVGSKPMIDYIFGQMAAMPEIGRVNVVTNQKFAPQFADWAAGHGGAKPISVVNDLTTSDADKLGAIGDIRLVIERNQIDDDLLIVAGDNLFDFPLREFVDFFHGHGSAVGLYDTGDIEIMTQYAVVQVDPASQRIVDFVEKPPRPKSTLAATAIYLWKREHLPLLERYKNEGGNMDSPGHFPVWLVKQVDVYGFRLPGTWMDIGTRAQYEAACRAYAA
jgi:glucose-1-phosphate thymidylyltransferase